MEVLISLMVGAIGGFAVHSISMSVSFKQRTIDNKIKVYDGLIAHWVRTRNFLYSKIPSEGSVIPPEDYVQFDQMYGESQTLIGEVFLLCGDLDLAVRIHDINEKFFRTNWSEMKYEDANKAIDLIKAEVIALISEMRCDIKISTRFDRSDLIDMISWIWRSSK